MQESSTAAVGWLGAAGLLDAIDIALVAVLLYAALSWLRRSRGALLGVGVGLAVGLYASAGLLGLELTTLVFQAIGAAALVAAVVVFQDELRQTFEEIAQRVIRRDAGPRMRVDARELLVRSVFALAREKRGALIVLPGSQLIERHCRGGVELGGEFSAELLASIFDPHSDGHDGAVILEGGEVSQFGVHLPLARGGAPAGGTRHSAALGLAERSDALCIVVSEERGVVSVAHEGRLHAVTAPEELAQLIDRVLLKRRPAARRRDGVPLIGADPAGKLAALGAALVLWLWFVPGGEVVEAHYSLPVHVDDVPEGLEVGELAPALVEATLQGRRRDFALASPPSIHVSAAELPRKAEIALEGKALDHADSLSLVDLSAERVALRLEPTRDERDGLAE